MNTLAFDPVHSEPQLVDFVDFKWLLANEGHRVDVPRMQCDPSYAQRCLALALDSHSALLHRCARKLLGSAAN